MRRALIVLLLAVVSSAPRAQTGSAARPQQADGIVRLLSDIENALLAGKMDVFRPLTAPSMPVNAQMVFQSAVANGGVSAAAVRERARRPLETGELVEVLAEVFVGHGRNGRLATWVMTARPRPGAPGQYELIDLKEPAVFDNLIRLALDDSRQFSVHNLVLEAPDLTLKMTSGTAFVAEDATGITALVLRGNATVTFTPKDEAERGQLAAFGGKPGFETAVESAYVRLDSSEFQSRVGDRVLVPAASVDPRELSRARATFDEQSRKTYNVDLRDLTQGQWSFAPSYGSLVIEFKTSRYGWLTYARSPLEAEDVTLFDRLRNRNISSYTSSDKLSLRGPYYSEDDLVPYDVERYALDVTFDPRNMWIAGRATLSLRIKSFAASIVTLRLAEPLAVSSVSSPTFGRLLTMRVVGQSNLIINLPSPLSRDAMLVLDVVYSGRLNPQAADRESPAGQTPIGSGDTRSTETPLVVMPEPRFLYSNQVMWYPQSQVTDYAVGTIKVQVPAEYQVVANGSLARSTVAPAASGRSGETTSVRSSEYVVDRPARYLSVLITRLVEIGRLKVDVPAVAQSLVEPSGAHRITSVNLDVVSTPRMASVNRQLPQRVAEMLKVYADLIGEAPYPNFTLAGVDENLPGGHSPAFFALWLQPLSSSPYSWLSDPLSFDYKYPQFFLAHEVAHQWWGQAVGWKNYREQWLSEGFAQYFAVLFVGKDRGGAMMDELLIQMKTSAEDYSARGPIALGYRLGHVQGDSRIFRAVIYNKSAVVLHMLRRLMGDEAFFAGLRRYYRDWRYSKAGTDDLRVAFEAETHLKLSRFFERWVRQSGLPKLRVTSRVDTATNTAVIRIEQVGDVFDLPFTVTVQYSDGRSDVVTIPVTAAVTDWPISLKGPVRRIVTRDELTLAEYVK